MPVLISKRARSVASFNHWRKCVALITLLSGLVACSQPGDSELMLRQYQNDLASLNQRNATPPPRANMPPMPRSTDMRTEIARVSIGLLDSMQLDKCRVGALVAQRNSALGKMQSPSARLRYELDSLLALTECRQSGAIEDERISALLTDAVEQKRALLPDYADRALATGDEMRHALRPDARMLPPAGNVDEAALAALDYVASVLQQAFEDPPQAYNLDGYNRAFQTLAQSNFLPRLWRTQYRASTWLQSLNNELGDFAQAPDCDLNWQSAHQHFKTQIEPLLLRWNQFHQLAVSDLERLHRLSKQVEWKNYLNTLIQPVSNIGEKIAQHNASWDAIAAVCKR